MSDQAKATDLLKNVLVLQHRAARTLMEEMHQQTEAYVQQFGRLPLSQESTLAAHEAKIPLRDLDTSLTETCAVSELILQATTKYCGQDMCVTSPDLLEAFLQAARTDVKTVEDRAQAVFILEATLSIATPQDMQSRFESKQGYDLLLEWFAWSCSYADATSKNFTEVLLIVFQRHVPQMPFARKKLLRDLGKYRKFTRGKKNKDLLQSVMDQYREVINA